MKGTIAIVLGLALLVGIWGCGSKDSGSTAAPTADVPGGPTPGGPGAPPGAPGMPGAPMGPGMGSPGAAAPSPGGASKSAEAKSGEKAAPKEADDSDDPFSSISAPAGSEPGKATVTGALGKAFLRAAGSSGSGKAGK